MSHAEAQPSQLLEPLHVVVVVIVVVVFQVFGPERQKLVGGNSRGRKCAMDLAKNRCKWASTTTKLIKNKSQYSENPPLRKSGT